MNCPKCGKELNSKVCGQCGFNMERDEIHCLGSDDSFCIQSLNEYIEKNSNKYKGEIIGTLGGHSRHRISIPTNPQVLAQNHLQYNTPTAGNAQIVYSPYVSQDDSRSSPADTYPLGWLVLYPLGWLVFFANVWFCFSPFINNGSIYIDDALIYSMNYKPCMVTSLIALGFLCFSERFTYDRFLGHIVSWAWAIYASFTFASIKCHNMGDIVITSALFYKQVAIFLGIFATVLIFSSKMGGVCENIPITTSKAVYETSFRVADIIFVILVLGINLTEIFLLLDLPKFYSLVTNYNLFHWAIYAAPILMFIVLKMSSLEENRMARAWFAVTMATSYECVLLSLPVIDDSIGRLFLGIIVFLAAFAVIACIATDYNVVANITIFLIFVILIAGMSAVFDITKNGLDSISKDQIWWLTTPLIADMVLATGFSIVQAAKK